MVNVARNDPKHRWLFVAAHGASVDPDLMNEALAVAPTTVERGAAILPRQRPPSGETCRICGQVEPLSREHVPPRSAANIDRSRAYSLAEWLARESLDDIPGGRVEQGGVWGYTLCERCNSRTGRLSGEYRRWAVMAGRILTTKLPDTIEQIDRSPVTNGVSIQVPGALPGVFVRQVLSLMCTTAGTWKLTDLYPELRDALLDGRTCPMPAGLRLGMALCPGPVAFIAGPSLDIDVANRRWRWLTVFAWPPLAFELELAASANRPPSAMCEIGNFLQVGESVRADVELELIIGFTHTMFPGDWRTRCQIERHLGLDGQSE